MKNNQSKTGIDRQGFEKLFDTHYDELRRYIYFKSGDIEVAEDIIQDTYLKVWEMRESVKAETARALLFTISANLLANRFKRQKLQLKLQQTVVEDRTYESPEFEMEVKEFDQKLQQVISELTEKGREVFLMNRMERMTYGEIAKLLNISVKAVEKRMSKALEFVHLRIEQKI